LSSTATTPQWALDAAAAMFREGRSLIAQGASPTEAAKAVVAWKQGGITIPCTGPDAPLWTKAAAARARFMRSKGLTYEQIAEELAPAEITISLAAVYCWVTGASPAKAKAWEDRRKPKPKPAPERVYVPVPSPPPAPAEPAEPPLMRKDLVDVASVVAQVLEAQRPPTNRVVTFSDGKTATIEDVEQ